MQSHPATDALIEQLIDVTCAGVSDRQKRAFRESLRGLVRLAKAEQMLELRLNAHRLTSPLDQKNSLPE